MEWSSGLIGDGDCDDTMTYLSDVELTSKQNVSRCYVSEGKKVLMAMLTVAMVIVITLIFKMSTMDCDDL